MSLLQEQITAEFLRYKAGSSYPGYLDPRIYIILFYKFNLIQGTSYSTISMYLYDNHISSWGG